MGIARQCVPPPQPNIPPHPRSTINLNMGNLLPSSFLNTKMTNPQRLASVDPNLNTNIALQHLMAAMNSHRTQPRLTLETPAPAGLAPRR